MKFYNTYAKAAGSRKRNEMTIFDTKKQKYKNTKIVMIDMFGRKIRK